LNILEEFKVLSRFIQKIRQSGALFWFGLRIVGFCSNILLTKTIDDSPAFLEHVSAEKIAVRVHDPEKGDD
jgi:hypothetical protein